MNKFRYIDKKILCSYDLSEEFFKELGVEVYDIIPLRKVFVIFTDKGKKILKRINSSEERVEFINKALNIIKEKDKYILQYCTNSKGKIITKWHGKSFVLLDMIDGREATFTNPIEVEWCTKSLANFHKASEGIINDLNEKEVNLNGAKNLIYEFLNDLCIITEIEREYQVNGEIPSRWLNIRSLIDKDRTLVTVMDITKDVYTRQKIEYERDYDILTHLLNRRAFKRRIQEILSGAPASGLGLSAMVMWDLDNLKYVNDTYGHDYGDQYIQKAAGVFAGLSLVGAIVGRMAGDEFLAFVPNCGSKEKLMDLLNQVKNKLNATKIIMPDGEELAIRASGGVAWYPDDGITYEMLKKYADFAMYDTKNSYKGAVKEFDQRVYEKDSYLLRGREQINRLIEDRMVDYAFQPIVDARSGQVHAYEALMRPRLGELSNPSDVLRLATVQSRLPELEELTFTQALKDYQRQREAFGDARIFINSIPNQLIDYGVIAKFQEKYGLEPNKLVVEIIENEQTDAGVMEKKIDIIRKMKAGLAIDDYGSGYSSELTLLYMSPDYVKIDMSIVRNVDKDVNRQALVASTIQYSKTRNIKIIGEGVETYDEMETLIRLGVDYMQGYYLGRPDLVARPVRESLREKILELQKLCVDKE